MGMGQNETARGPLVFVLVSIYQGSILGLPFFGGFRIFDPHPGLPRLS